MEDQLKYKRVLIKLSGEALSAGADGEIYNYAFVEEVCRAIKKLTEMKVQVAIVVGGGNIWRGRNGGNMDRTRADHMGMLATAINALALQDTFEQIGVSSRVMTAIQMNTFAEQYFKEKAVSHLEKGHVVIFGCGTGCPFFSTDTAGMLRAAEIGADVVMMAKNIDAVYSDDPKKNPDAVKLEEITYKEILDKNLKVIDAAAAAFGRENNIALHIFGITDPENLIRAIKGEKIGTIIH
ncbi:MAG: UMP kinase [Firmicutes bacterium]|nr:UMP kinase [Candidatus Colimorpha enterica]